MNTRRKSAKSLMYKRPISSNSFTYGNLECRNLLAGITFDADTGTIHIEGTSNADVAMVESASDAILRVELSGFEPRSFERVDVTQVEFRGFAGDDEFFNNTDISSRAFGNAGNDTLYGGSSADFMSGGDGNDTLKGFDGNDEMYGGAGDDEFYGGTGADRMYGGDGNDRLLGFGGRDVIFGGPGDDYIWAGKGNDILRGGEGDDRLRGDLDDDLLFGQGGDDFIDGFSGDDILRGGEGDDFLRGGSGVDRIFGGVGNDQLEGGGFLYGGLGNDRLNGGVDDDVIVGGEGDDTLAGDRGNDRLFGGPGNDLIQGGEGNDLLAGADGDDRLSGYDGDDLLFGSFGNDVLDGNLGNDRLLGGSGDDFLKGGAGMDDLSGGKDNDLLRGGKGNDILKGGDGNDRLYGLDGDDLLYGQKGLDSLFGGGGRDFARGGAGPDRALVVDGDSISDLNSEDVEVEFRDLGADAVWSHEEILVIDNGLVHLVNATNNLALFNAPITNQQLVFVKAPPIETPDVTETVIDPITSERQYWIREFDETSERRRQLVEVEILREIADAWSSNVAISSVLPDQSTFFSEFESLSSWTSDTPDNMNDFVLSGDGSQYYSVEANFARLPLEQVGSSLPPIDPMATLNSREDFASLWTFIYTPFNEQLRAEIQPKLDKIDELFSLLSFT